jgi:sporulation protein YlmC with PRC-barrel domain
MLQLSNAYLGRPVFSLRAGNTVALTVEAIINPADLKVEGYYCRDSIDRKQILVLVSQDIRDLLPRGVIVNDHDVLMDPHDLVRLKKVLDLRFELIGKPVVTTSKRHLGKIEDYAIDMGSMYIAKLYVGKSFLRNFMGDDLTIDRSQIVEITDRQIIIQDPLQPIPLNSPVPA